MILLIGAVAAILVLFAALGIAVALRESTRRDWADEMANLTLMLAEHAGQTLFSAHTVLDSLHDVVDQQKLETASDYKAFASRESSFHLLVDRTSANPIIDVATFVGSNGEVLNFSRTFPPPAINLSDRDYFQAHRENPSLASFTSVPVQNKGNGNWVFYISRRVNNQNGEMLGLILVGVSVEVFSNIYKNVTQHLGAGASISLYRDDFTMMTRWPFIEKLVGEKNLTSATHRAIADDGKNNDVVFTNSARLTENNILQERITATRRVDRYPLIVTSVITEEHYLHGWRDALWWIVGLTVVSLSLLFWGLSWLLRANGRIEQELIERTRAQERIEHMANHDSLTSLPNRRLLSAQLHRCLADCARHPVNCGLLFLDLDNFKEINDTHGHDQGDLLLKEVAIRLLRCVRKGDTVARVGGDEFAIVLDRLDANAELAAANLNACAEKVTHALAQPFRFAGITHHTTVSIGMAMFGMDAARVDDLFKQADIAMYQAKLAGKNTHRFFDASMQLQVDERSELVAELRQALGNSEIALYYQPQFQAPDKLIGAEALLRWSSPRWGPVSPSIFVPLAEQAGLINALGSWVLETACQTLVSWSKLPNLAHLTLAVNVSSQQFKMPNFVETVLAALQRTDARADRLKLELTESMLVGDLADVSAKMTRLKALGISLSLDDFGTGYSSMKYLRELSIDQLKIDWTFVRDVLTDTNDATIVRAITTLGRSLGVDVIAEGVETQEQVDFLISIQCNTFQGYFFSHPLPLSAFNLFVSQLKSGLPTTMCVSEKN